MKYPIPEELNHPDVVAMAPIVAKVAEHLGKQRAVSRREDSALCFYRGPNGSKCGIGCLFSDEAYNDVRNDGTPERNSASSLLELDDWPAISEELTALKPGQLNMGEFSKYLDSLQTYHDVDFDTDLSGNEDATDEVLASIIAVGMYLRIYQKTGAFIYG